MNDWKEINRIIENFGYLLTPIRVAMAVDEKELSAEDAQKIKFLVDKTSSMATCGSGSVSEEAQKFKKHLRLIHSYLSEESIDRLVSTFASLNSR